MLFSIGNVNVSYELTRQRHEASDWQAALSRAHERKCGKMQGLRTSVGRSAVEREKKAYIFRLRLWSDLRSPRNYDGPDTLKAPGRFLSVKIYFAVW